MEHPLLHARLKRNTSLEKLKSYKLKLFPSENPFTEFQEQEDLRSKLWWSFEFFFPIVKLRNQYNCYAFGYDVLAGLMAAVLAILQGVGYAQLANLPPEIGLYSSVVPPLVYAILCSSRDTVIGPSAVSSLIMASLLSKKVSSVGQPLLYLRLALTSTLFAGIFQTTLGLLRFGFVMDFLSKATLTAFKVGTAFLVIAQQLKQLLGIDGSTPHTDIISIISSIFEHIRDEFLWQNFVMGIVLLGCLLIAKFMGKKGDWTFWVSRAAPFILAVVSTCFVYYLEPKNIPTMGALQKDLILPSFNLLYFQDLSTVIQTGIIVGIISITEGIAVGRSFSAPKNYQIDETKEMVAMGLMNVAGSCTLSYITTGSFSRSVFHKDANGQTSISNIVMSVSVFVALFLLPSVSPFIPKVVLSVMVVTAMIDLIDYEGALIYWRVDKLDFISCLISFAAVMCSSIPVGLAVGIGVSIIKILLHVLRPNIVALGNIEGTNIYKSLNQYNEASEVPELLILAIQSPICFLNCTYVRQRILQLIKEEDAITGVILDMSAVTDLDTCGMEMMDELNKTLRVDQNIMLALANALECVEETLIISGGFVKSDIYRCIGEAVAGIRNQPEE